MEQATVNVTSTAGGEPEGHLAEMEAKTNQINNPEANPVEALENTPEARPEWLPEKFKSPEDMAKAYGELEKKNSAPAGEQSTGETPTQEEAQETAEKLGIDFQGLSQEFAEHGQLSDEAYTDLEAKGLPKDVVDAYIKGQQLTAQAFDTEVQGAIGGNDNYAAMTEWAKDNLSETEISTFNNLVGSGDADTAKLAVQGLWQRYSPNHTHSPKTTVQGQTSAGNSGGYESQFEMKQDMSDPRYGKDASFTRSVENKVIRSGSLL